MKAFKDIVSEASFMGPIEGGVCLLSRIATGVLVLIDRLNYIIISSQLVPLPKVHLIFFNHVHAQLNIGVRLQEGDFP